MTKDTFVKIANMLDEFFNGEPAKALDALGIGECIFTKCMDTIIDAIDAEMDPDQKAKNDEYCIMSGSYLYEWLFGMNEFNEICATAEALYDYIIAQYKINES